MKKLTELLVLNRVTNFLVANQFTLLASNHVLVIRGKAILKKNVRVPQRILQVLSTTIRITIKIIVHYLHLIVAVIGEKVIVSAATISNKQRFLELFI
ncbi:hypothetical protein [Peribacillus loiseleuriae]|uniref:Uncharacterized protein n=1 Tax=Peribacillus loiseleuriae TaxID=1679170 RepID=A0A0K9GS70_9BACI|nr:hypothetical protein [Peribacillus loiseleuriae]KMY49524.1 hypothetical protein AC625_08165 [Peribacillus loiseleuriae]